MENDMYRIQMSIYNYGNCNMVYEHLNMVGSFLNFSSLLCQTHHWQCRCRQNISARLSLFNNVLELELKMMSEESEREDESKKWGEKSSTQRDEFFLPLLHLIDVHWTKISILSYLHSYYSYTVLFSIIFPHLNFSVICILLFIINHQLQFNTMTTTIHKVLTVFDHFMMEWISWFSSDWT